MKLTKLLKGAVFCMAFSLAGSVSGQGCPGSSASNEYYWLGDDSDWTNPDNWCCDDGGSCDHDYPGQTSSSDIVIIAATSHDPVLDVSVEIAGLEVQNNATLFTDDHTMIVNGAGGLVLEPDALLLIEEDGQLTLSGSDPSGMDPHLVGGSVHLQTNTSTLLVAVSMTIGAYPGTPDVPGFIIGENDSAQLQVTDEQIMTLDGTTLSGALTVDAETGTRPATLANFGFVAADQAGDTLKLGANLVLVDCDPDGMGGCDSVGEWQSEASDAVLEFSRAADGSHVTNPSLDGDFTAANCGVFLFNANVETAGNVTAVNAEGVIDTATGVCFEWNSGAADECDCEDFDCTYCP